MDPLEPEGFPSFEPEGFFVSSDENSQVPVRQKSLTSTKVQHAKVQHVGVFISVKDAAAKLGVTSITITRWCESGKLPAFATPYGKKITYKISPHAVEMLLAAEFDKKTESRKKQKAENKCHFELISIWKTAMAKGFINGRAFSKATIDDYSFYIDEFFKRQKTVSINSLKEELARIPASQIAKRQHCFKAVVCFAKVLIAEGVLSEGFLKESKPLYPKRHIPPKRHTVNEDDIKNLLKACSTAEERLIINLLALTGLRATEACNLRWIDIDLSAGFLIVWLGKGGKERKVGIPKSLEALIINYQATIPKLTSEKHLFLNSQGKPMNRNGLYQRLERIGKQAGVHCNPHALRRAFVTINANKGRPLVILQRSCGHSDIKTTISYCLTAEQEVIEAMKDWD